MKKFMKFIPVALGVLALASCSNDDFFGDSPAKVDIRANMGEGDMVVTVAEPLAGGNAFTRALRDWNPPTDANPYPADPLMYFQNGDQIRVYDQSVLAFDIYQYKPTHAGDPTNEWAFERIHNKSNVANPAFALYPREDIIRGMFEMNDDVNHTNVGSAGGTYSDYHSQGWAKVHIAPEMDYWADYTTTSPNNEALGIPLYQERFPLFGKVKALDKGYLEANLEYLTGGLCWESNGVPEYARFLRVRMQDPKTKEYLIISGRFKTTLLEDGDVKLDYIDTGEVDADNKPILEVDESTAAHITYKDVLPSNERIEKDGDNADIYKDYIIVNLDPEKGIGLKGGDEKHTKVFVPLVCTDGKVIDLIVETSMDGLEWTENWRKTTDIERGRFYYSGTEYNQALKGTTICAISDALAILAEGAKDGSTINVTCDNPIEITKECWKLEIPNKNVTFNIDFSKGIYSKDADKELLVEYVDPNGAVTPAGVNITGKRFDKFYPFSMDVQLPKTVFGLTNIPYTKAEADAVGASATAPVKAVKIDASKFVTGDGVNKSLLNGSTMQLSDNVTELTVDAQAALVADPSDIYACGNLIVADPAGEPGYTAAGIEAVTVNGLMGLGIDGHNTAAKPVAVTVAGTLDKTATPWEGEYAALRGEIRTKGTITVENRGLILPCGTGTRGVAAYGAVTVKDQSFIAGPIFSKDATGGIIINNENFNAFNVTGGSGKLSDVIYELYGDDAIAKKVVDLIKEGYGPLYAEEGSVKVTAKNSDINITDKTLATTATPEQLAFILGQLNEHAQKTIDYSVYAKQDIDLVGDKIKAQSSSVKMWAEYDIHLGGLNTTETGGQVEVYGSVQADHDLVVVGKSAVHEATVGRNATIFVQDRDGKGDYRAVDNLNFPQAYTDASAPQNNGNTLYLYQGYVKDIANGTADEPVLVNLTHYSEPAFAAIATVVSPDNLVPTNESKWNGQQIANTLKGDYVKGDHIWTATQLAAQLTGVTTHNALLRSDINLMSQPWSGNIKPWTNYSFTGKRYDLTSNDRRAIKNLKIAGNGFINQDSYGLTMKNIKFVDVECATPAAAGGALKNLGVVAGLVGSEGLLENVAVTLKAGDDAYFGSNGTINKKAQYIGGLIGQECGNLTLKGVRVNANNVPFKGWSRIGGFVGAANGNVTIVDSDAADEFGPLTSRVTNFKVDITHVDTKPSLINVDLEQGMYGRFIGTLGGFPAATVNIQSTANKYDETFEVTGANLAAASFSGYAKIGAKYYKGIFYYKAGKQTLVGQSGKTPNAAENPVYINDTPYWVQRYSMTTAPDLTSILYFWQFSGENEVELSTIPSAEQWWLNP